MKDIQESIEVMTSAAVKYDCIIFIEGNRGNGKSTLAYKILNNLKVEQPFKPKRDIVYTREDVIKHLSSKINGCIFADEMINVAFKRDFFVEDQKELLRGFDMYRDKRNVFVGCIPKFVDLDQKLQKLCKLRITVVRRGIAILHMQNQSIYTSDVWDIKSNQRIEQKWALRGASNPRYSQLTTVRGILRFGDLPPDLRDMYDAIKEEKRGHVFAKYHDDELMMSPEQKFLNNTIKLLKAAKLTPDKFEMLCTATGKDRDSIRSDINKMLKKEGDVKRFRDYCCSTEKKVKRDMLGFSIDSKALQAINTLPSQNTTTVKEEIKHDIREETEDIFDFAKI